MLDVRFIFYDSLNRLFLIEVPWGEVGIVNNIYDYLLPSDLTIWQEDPGYSIFADQSGEHAYNEIIDDDYVINSYSGGDIINIGDRVEINNNMIRMLSDNDNSRIGVMVYPSKELADEVNFELARIKTDYFFQYGEDFKSKMRTIRFQTSAGECEYRAQHDWLVYPKGGEFGKVVRRYIRNNETLLDISLESRKSVGGDNRIVRGCPINDWKKVS